MRERRLLGSFGPVRISVPRARMAAVGASTRRVKRALAALFGGAVGKDVVSRTWRKVKTDWDAWNGRDLGVSRSESAWAGEDVVRLILDGTVVRVRLDRKATNISLGVANTWGGLLACGSYWVPGR